MSLLRVAHAVHDAALYVVEAPVPANTFCHLSCGLTQRLSS